MADAAAPPKTKKLPFKPTALRKSATPKASSPDDDSKKNKKDEDDALALFRRSKEMAPIVARDRERRLQRLKKQKEAEERRRPSALEKRRLDDEAGNDDTKLIESQLRECSQQDEEASSFALDESVTVTGDSFNELVTPPPSKRTRSGSSSSKKRPVTPARQSLQESPSARQLRSRSKYSTPRRRSRTTTPHADTPSGLPIISLDSEDDEDANPFETPSKPRHGEIVEISDEPEPPQTQQADQNEEEDEFAEYIRRAEEEKRNLTSRTSEGPSGSKAPIACIIVTSAINGTRGCHVKTFFDKALLHVKLAWVAIQDRHGIHLTADPSELILTWRGSKVYNYSTLHSLGLRPYGDRVVADGHSRKGLSSDGMMVNMEIWTPDMFKKWEEEEERRRKIDAGELSDEDVAAKEQEEQEAQVTLRVILKARELDEVRLTVRPATTVETLVTGFRAKSGLGADKDVKLWFDGEVMEEHVTMEEADIEDMDAIEVHVK